jgi:hypothetical protein
MPGRHFDEDQREPVRVARHDQRLRRSRGHSGSGSASGMPAAVAQVPPQVTLTLGSGGETIAIAATSSKKRAGSDGKRRDHAGRL